MSTFDLVAKPGVTVPNFVPGSVPQHIAIVMDGNGRWANQRGLTRVEGHKAGEAALLDVVASRAFSRASLKILRPNHPLATCLSIGGEFS